MHVLQSALGKVLTFRNGLGLDVALNDQTRNCIVNLINTIALEV